MQIVAPRKSPITPPRTLRPYSPARTVPTATTAKLRAAAAGGSKPNAPAAAEASATTTRFAPSSRRQSPNQL